MHCLPVPAASPGARAAPRMICVAVAAEAEQLMKASGCVSVPGCGVPERVLPFYVLCACVYPVSPKSDAKIQIVITTTHQN